jgi:hypothetical protein
MGRKRKAIQASDLGLKFTKQVGSQEDTLSSDNLVARGGYVENFKIETAEIHNNNSSGKTLPFAKVGTSRCKAVNVPLLQNGVKPQHKKNTQTLPVKVAPRTSLSISKARHNLDKPTIAPKMDEDLGSWQEGLALIVSAMVLTFLLRAFPDDVDRRLRWCLWPLVSGGIMKAGKALVGI